MSKFRLAALAAVLVLVTVPALASENVADDPVFGEPMVLQIAEGEQVFCGGVSLQKVGDDQYVFTLEANDDNKELCAQEPQIPQGDNILF